MSSPGGPKREYRSAEHEGIPVSAPSAPARIRIRGAGKRYDAHQVFQDVDLTVGEREVVAIIGPSGCGKTTLLRTIDGLIPLADGLNVIMERLRIYLQP